MPIVLMICVLVMLLFPFCKREGAMAQRIRPPARAGQFYPADPQALRREIKEALGRWPPERMDGEVVGLWVPHAGYIYSGLTAAGAFRFLEGRSFDAVVLVGPAHTQPLRGGALADWEAFATPLGRVRLDTDLLRKIHHPNLTISQGPHAEEHAIEVQLPFLQILLPEVPIVPLVVGQMSLERTLEIAEALVRALQGRRVLLIASSDMSHYPSDADARRADGEILDAVATLDPRRVWEAESAVLLRGIPGLACGLCGKEALVLVMEAVRRMGANAVKILPYRNSAEVSGDTRRVVGYGAAVFYRKGGSMGAKLDFEDIPFTKEEIRKLFRIARESILAALEGRPLPRFEVTEDRLKIKRGVFVTLTNRGRLRGCIGHFGSDYPLHEIVQKMAVAAATQDYRFAYNPVTPKEMVDIDIKISILSDLKKIDSIDQIEIGKHGIWVTQGGRSGTYLPEVATEMGWSREQFLSSCCAEKAGLPPDAWKRGAEVYLYTTQILEEKKVPSP